MDTNRITLNEYLGAIKNFDKTYEYFNIYKEACRIDIESLWNQHQEHVIKENHLITEESKDEGPVGAFQKGMKTLKSWWDKIVKWFLGLFRFFPRFLKKFFTMFSTFAIKFRDYKSKTDQLADRIKGAYSGDNPIDAAWAEWMASSNTKFKRPTSAFKYKPEFSVNKKIQMMLIAQYSYQPEKEFKESGEEDMVLKLANRCGSNIIKLLHQGVDLFLEGEIPETGIQSRLEGKLKDEYKDGRNKGNSLLALLYNTEKLIDIPVTVKMPNVLTELPKDFSTLARKMDSFFRRTEDGKKQLSRVDRIEDLEIYKFLKEYRQKINKEYTYEEYEFTKANYSQDQKDLKEGIEKLQELTEKVKKMDEESEVKSGQSTTQNMLESLNCMARTQSLLLDNVATLYQLILDSFDLRFKIIESFNKFLDDKK